MIRRPPRSTQSRSSAASDVYKRQEYATAYRVASPQSDDCPERLKEPAHYSLSAVGEGWAAATIPADVCPLEPGQRVSPLHRYLGTSQQAICVAAPSDVAEFAPVSYTHLTLPTIYS